MLILDTLNKTTIWGGTRLQKFGSDPLEPHVGSLYTVAGNGELSCMVLNGEYIGLTLYDVYRDNREMFGYDKYEPFPLLIGLVDGICRFRFIPAMNMPVRTKMRPSARPKAGSSSKRRFPAASSTAANAKAVRSSTSASPLGIGTT